MFNLSRRSYKNLLSLSFALLLGWESFAAAKQPVCQSDEISIDAKGCILPVWVSGELLPPLQYAQRVKYLQFSKDGKFMAVVFDDASAQVVELSTSKSKSMRCNSFFDSTVFSNDGRFILRCQGGAKILELATNKETDIDYYKSSSRFIYSSSSLSPSLSPSLPPFIYPLPYSYTPDQPILLSPEAKFVINKSMSGSISISELATGKKIEVKNSNGAYDVGFSPDEKIVTMKLFSGDVIKAIRLDTGEEREIKHDKAVDNVVCSSDGKFVATASLDGAIKIAEFDTHKEIKTIQYGGNFHFAYFSPDGRFARILFRDQTVKVVDLVTGHERTIQNGVSDEFLPGGNLLFSRSALNGAPPRDRFVKLMGLTTGQEIKFQNVMLQRLTPDEKFLVVALNDGNIKLIELSTFKETAIHRQSPLNNFQFSEDGKFLIAGSSDGKVNVIELSTGRSTEVQMKPGAYLMYPQVSPDGKFLVALLPESKVNITELSTGLSSTLSKKGISNAWVLPTGDILAEEYEEGVTSIKRLKQSPKICLSEGFTNTNSAEKGAEVDERALIGLLSSPCVPASAFRQYRPPQKAELVRPALEHLVLARTHPEKLTASALDVVDAPAAYHRLILKTLRESRRIGADFKPTTQQALNAVRAILEDPKSTSDDVESAAWLLGVSDLPLDERILDLFKIPEGKLLKDVEEMVGKKPWKYKELPDFAVIKLAKALMSYSNDDYACIGKDSNGIGGTARKEIVSKIINWIGSYGNELQANRALFAKLARVVLQKKKLCETDRNLLLHAMRDWRGSTAKVQYELSCALAENLADKPLQEHDLSEAVLISQAAGLNAEMSGSAWIEQMRAFGDLRAASGGGALPLDEELLYEGLLQHVLGSPQGKIKVRNSSLFIRETKPQKLSVVRLCQALKANVASNGDDPAKMDAGFLQGASLFLQYAREHLDQRRPWPQGFEANSELTSAKRSLREEFVQADMAQDLKALESSCAELPDHGSARKLSIYQDEPSTVSVKPRGTSGAPKQPKRRSRPAAGGKRDFDPAGRR